LPANIECGVAKAGAAAAMVVSAAEMLCALAAAGVQRDGLGGCST
jgi:hypothetical protein